ncbi:isocitrate lyase/PEP mutase family protein [Chachezhania sediminis]|uniref:isocitrate lyase/PEP mutase family protein n=1 Tax=Chachezhania sediminis TaxID=2599291 RepID=UPI00131DE5AA|nr:isocitrate lyase/phosphoenolpyruvate mutase family protein [Chachezhania sediminis]
MSQADLARVFAAMHRSGHPLILYNVWDVGSAKAVARAGAHAIATSSWALSTAHGIADGERVPFAASTLNLARIVRAVSLPVTHDFEAGFADDLRELSSNFARIIDVGAVGVNFDDRIGGTGDLRNVEDQSARIATLRRTAEAAGVPVFINARTDLFFKGQSREVHARLMPQALDRAAAYADAGADGLFVPGLLDHDLIEQLCGAAPLPVNVMQPGETADIRALAGLGVSRISFGPAPFIAAMAQLTERASRIFARA